MTPEEYLDSIDPGEDDTPLRRTVAAIRETLWLINWHEDFKTTNRRQLASDIRVSINAILGTIP